jgi:hypothetical protein
MAKDSYSFADFKYDPSSFSANAFTAPEASRLYSNIFGSSAPSYDFNSYKFDTAFSPDTITRAFTPASSSRSSGTDWLGTIGKGLEALNKARSYQSSRDENALDKYLKSGAANTNLVGQGRSWKMYQPSPRQKTTQTGGSSSPLGPIGSAVGIAGTALGVFGPLGPAAGAAIGGGLGSLFG